MKPVIERKDYEKRMNRIAYNMAPLVLLVAAALVTAYHGIPLGLKGELRNLGTPEMLSKIFFETAMGWAGVYFIKRTMLAGMVNGSYKDADEDPKLGFIPAVRGTSIVGSAVGNLYFDDADVYFNPRRMVHDRDKMIIPFSQLAVETEVQKSNLMLHLFWGETKVLRLTNRSTGKSYSYLVPDAEETAKAIQTFVGTLG